MACAALLKTEKLARTSAASVRRQIVAVTFIDPPTSIDAGPLLVGSPPSVPPADPGQSAVEINDLAVACRSSVTVSATEMCKPGFVILLAPGAGNRRSFAGQPRQASLPQPHFASSSAINRFRPGLSGNSSASCFV